MKIIYRCIMYNVFMFHNLNMGQEIPRIISILFLLTILAFNTYNMARVGVKCCEVLVVCSLCVVKMVY